MNENKSTEATFVTDAAELHTRQQATHARSRDRSRATAVEALREVEMTEAAVDLETAMCASEIDAALMRARAVLTYALSLPTPSIHRIAALRTALGAVSEAWGWAATCSPAST